MKREGVKLVSLFLIVAIFGILSVSLVSASFLGDFLKSLFGIGSSDRSDLSGELGSLNPLSSGCVVDSDCGVYLEGLYCRPADGNLWTSGWYSCDNKECILHKGSRSDNKLVEECLKGPCENKACVNVVVEGECYDDGDCGTERTCGDQWAYFCNLNNLHKIQECYFPSCSENKKCENCKATSSELVETCEYECREGSEYELGATCVKEGQCVSECEAGETECMFMNLRECGNYDGDGCNEWKLSSCGEGLECVNGECVEGVYKLCFGLGECISDCSGKICGDDGCGGSCGRCSFDQDCVNGKCVLLSECIVNNDCSSLIDDCSYGICNSGKCEIRYNSSISVCREPAGECDAAEMCTGNSAECPLDVFKSDGTVCTGGTCKNGQCIKLSSIRTCQIDGDCEPGELCINGACADGSCDTAEDCPEGYSCLDGICTAFSTKTCETDTDCSPGEVCLDGTCVVDNCETDEDCDPGEVCLDGTCVVDPFECDTDADCSTGMGTEKYCDGSKECSVETTDSCVITSTDSSCSSSTASPSCKTCKDGCSYGECNDYYTGECTIDSDCGGDYCTQGTFSCDASGNRIRTRTCYSKSCAAGICNYNEFTEVKNLGYSEEYCGIDHCLEEELSCGESELIITKECYTKECVRNNCAFPDIVQKTNLGESILCNPCPVRRFSFSYCDISSDEIISNNELNFFIMGCGGNINNPAHQQAAHSGFGLDCFNFLEELTLMGESYTDCRQASCGDGMCNCGEHMASWPSFLECDPNQGIFCPDEATWIACPTDCNCENDETCGNGMCDCGEDSSSCWIDCSYDSPWSEPYEASSFMSRLVDVILYVPRQILNLFS